MWNMKIFQLVRDAVIATEDSRFFEASRNRSDSLRRSSDCQLYQWIWSRRCEYHHSTSCKMYFLTVEKTLSRKAQEAWLAIQLERKFTKEEIFELYVNKVLYVRAELQELQRLLSFILGST